MPAPAARSVVRGVSIHEYSQIANVLASADIRNSWNASAKSLSQNANMHDDDDKNGGPNHLKAWMRFRNVKGARIAEALDITPGMVSDLASSKRALSAKWLRRLAPVLGTTPGLLLDHDPYQLDSDIIEIWANASNQDRKMIADIARTVVQKDGTNG